MIEKELDIRFKEAVELASAMTQASLPQDVQLRLYAFYKQATFRTLNYNITDNTDLRNAFKTNACIQISHLTPDEAKENYIEIIKSLSKKNPNE
jgi:acyl-CoA-binding protein